MLVRVRHGQPNAPRDERRLEVASRRILNRQGGGCPAVAQRCLGGPLLLHAGGVRFPEQGLSCDGISGTTTAEERDATGCRSRSIEEGLNERKACHDQ